jgi:hypothetical protein
LDSASIHPNQIWQEHIHTHGSVYWNHVPGDVGLRALACSKAYCTSRCPLFFNLIIIILCYLLYICTEICPNALIMLSLQVKNKSHFDLHAMLVHGVDMNTSYVGNDKNFALCQSRKCFCFIAKRISLIWIKYRKMMFL